ncbi:MAG: T9SS type A sorting domain-containing protein [Ferruginibacter sp.]
MKKFYVLLQMAICLFLLFPKIVKSQCASLTATCVSYESRCAATGAIKVTASGGSGSYKYKTTGPVNTNFTTSDSITGLAAGVYTVVVNDIVSNCNFTITNVVVAGSYQDPRFTLTKIDVNCDNASNGSIIVDTHSFGRAPFAYTIVAPSQMGVGTTNSSGIFPNLMAGGYSIEMTDSCGGIQTRQITVINYTWWIDSYSFTKTDCDEATGFIKVVDSHGNISTVGGIPGFMYGIVRSPGDTIWSSNPNFTFALLGHTSFQVVAKDACGIIKKGNAVVSLLATAAANVTTFNYLCSTFSASLTVGTNFLTPDFCLYDNSNTLVSCNSTGIFTGLTYGNYCINAHDACTDTTIIRCFSMTAPPININNTIAISDKVCASFTATVTGQVGLTSPQYCLYDSSNTLIICNATGIFTGLSYQPYCITMQDGCRDTLITRCFSAQPPTPVVPNIIDPYYVTCTNFGIHVGGDSLTLPEYCLYDTSGTLIMCNNTGVFDSIPLGSYCINIHDSCYDTTFIRCIDILIPIMHNDMMTAISHKTCSAFTVTVSSNTLINQEYCLYNDADILVSCNLTGEFNNVPYGAYCIKAHVTCPDTTLVSCFTVYPSLPDVGGTVQTSNQTCSTFSASVQSVQNFNNPTFCIYDSSDVLINCNPSGNFNNLPYGSYCIKITDDCYDTTISRCFSKSPIKVSLSGSGGKSCSYGWAQFNLNAGGNTGVLPVNIEIYNPDGSLFSQASYNSNSILIDSIPGVGSGIRYNIVATDNCGNKDSISLGSAASYFTHTPTAVPKCPSAAWTNGSGNIATTVSTNMGSLNVKVIKKNGVTLSPAITPNTVIAGVYTFIDLGPGTYILSSSENFCNKKLYDTVVIMPYQYPNLDRSSAYQCDVNGFSISAVASNGVGPFTYQIIGSQPTMPDITTAPQSSPIFTINNGANYSLVRLRALDACGNATLGDASILPLAINGAVSTFNCLSQPTTLSVDSLYNSSYAWYKKLEETSTDSVLIGTGTSYFIPTVLPSDTGIYVCYVTVNSGCITRTFTFHVDGNCWIILPLKLEEFKGQALDEKNLLTWKTSMEESLDRFIIERKNIFDEFYEIGTVSAVGNSNTIQQYRFFDNAPVKGKNIYRLKMLKKDHSYTYSNIIVLNNSHAENPFTLYPNPVTNKFTVDFGFATKHHYNIQLLNTMNQVAKEFNFYNDINRLEISRPKGLQKGIYILRVYDLDTKETFKEKIVFL